MLLNAFTCNDDNQVIAVEANSSSVFLPSVGKNVSTWNKLSIKMYSGKVNCAAAVVKKNGFPLLLLLIQANQNCCI